MWRSGSEPPSEGQQPRSAAGRRAPSHTPGSRPLNDRHVLRCPVPRPAIVIPVEVGVAVVIDVAADSGRRFTDRALELSEVHVLATIDPRPSRYHQRVVLVEQHLVPLTGIGEFASDPDSQGVEFVGDELLSQLGVVTPEHCRILQQQPVDDLDERCRLRQQLVVGGLGEHPEMHALIPTRDRVGDLRGEPSPRGPVPDAAAVPAPPWPTRFAGRPS